MTTRSSLNLQRAAFIIAMILFAFVGAYVLSEAAPFVEKMMFGSVEYNSNIMRPE